ncbi:MAG TPA: hydroxymethylglutaryl-CoA reductase, degradative, partial [Legionellaceae bacterium]|nr:hydroxymethylglutaryl-CoA reductase, degradative [Legionellaceae bacterium]
MSNVTMNDLFEGFSKLNREERYARLVSMGAMSPEEVAYLQNGGLEDCQLADHLIENVIGHFQMPLGVATHFCIDGQTHVIPMAVEETSIIAALSKTAKWIKQQGTITTHVTGEGILGQIQLAKVNNFARFERLILEHRTALIQKVNQTIAANMVKRGGGLL